MKEIKEGIRYLEYDYERLKPKGDTCPDSAVTTSDDKEEPIVEPPHKLAENENSSA